VLPESFSVTAASESPLEAPLLDGLPLDELVEELLLEELLEAPPVEDLPLEEPPLDVGPASSPPPADPPSPDSMVFTVPGELVPQAGTRGAVMSATPQNRTDRPLMIEP
jgi:hypothetical protein